jgi:hypothetical protein
MSAPSHFLSLFRSLQSARLNCRLAFDGRACLDGRFVRIDHLIVSLESYLLIEGPVLGIDCLLDCSPDVSLC